MDTTYQCLTQRLRYDVICECVSNAYDVKYMDIIYIIITLNTLLFYSFHSIFLMKV